MLNNEAKSVIEDIIQLLLQLEDDRKSCPACWAGYRQEHAPNCVLVRASRLLHPDEA